MMMGKNVKDGVGYGKTICLQQPPQLQHHNSEPIILPESTFTSFPPPGSRSQHTSPGRNLHRAPSLPGGSQLNFMSPSPLSSSSSNLSGLPHWPQCSGNLTRHASCGPTLGNMVQPRWLTDPGLLQGDHSSLLHSLAQQQQLQQLPPRNDLLAQHMMALQQRQSYAQLAALQPQLYSSYPSPSRKSSHRSRKNKGISQQASDAASQKSESGLQFRSKYMTSEEIESILKMKHSNSHSNDPYVNDYYHQARLAKKSRAVSHFYPSQLKDHQPRSRNSSEQQPQVHVDALGKITLPYIRRPRALLEVDSSPGSSDGSTGKHLEQEPLVAARVTIEDALGVLIDIVDIDRHLQSTRPQDGGAQVKRKRQILLEGLATALQLADPFSKTNQTTKDDVVFLRIATIPKGRKLLTKYIQLLVPGTEIARVVCMAIFRHLRFLFGGLPSDALAAETIANLAKAVTVCVQAMDLRALSACLAAVVCSSEQPPLRPIGSSAGDGASVVLISLLERAAEVVVAPRVVIHDGLWRASFDEFFNLLTKYCRSKYETIRSQNQGSAADVLEVAIKREMPAELLRASIRHTSDDQRNYLLNFGRKPSAIISESASHARGGQINSESLRGVCGLQEPNLHLQSTRPQDGGAQVKRKRQILLEGLATALQLADPFSKTNQTTKDDVVFLRIATIPKGRKLLTKYIQLLVPGTEIARVVCMAIFRHLRFLFGLPSDALAAETIANLAKAVTVCVQAMDLRLSACLAAVVCSSEQPPLRPIGSSAGDGASVVLISLLERAAEVVVAPRVVIHDGLWRASFDEFFNLLTKYCRSKYETIRSQNQGSAADVLEVAIKREMPAELLRASIRHTSDDQRNYLLNFGRKPSAIISESASHARGGQINSESVRVYQKERRSDN
ncbi:hypothetical protein Bca52824_020528 [Brassica carinata]|uniref:Uncharacterized protein n=1 Tax=Brassica carinata TaxID=52824 RepID=A0A8X7VTQ1_BRACI|nr:hypothetical protein Bca52824_020528 [Brassica carinata]